MVVYDKYYVKIKEKPQYMKKEKNTYCLVCKKKTDNKKENRKLENKIRQQDSKKSTFLKSIKQIKSKNSFYKL